MEVLSEAEVQQWLSTHSIEVNPYSKNHRPFEGSYQQVEIPKREGEEEAFAKRRIKEAGRFAQALLHVTDWSLYTEEEMALFSSLCLRHGELRSLVDAPGRLFSEDEREPLIEMLGLVMSMPSGWSAYLYFDSGVTYFTWEGELLDEWRIEEGQRGFNV